MHQYLSPAKVNFFLRVIGKRSDGYHELVSLMSPVSLYDSITICFNSDKIQVKCAHPQVPDDETNLAYRAAEVFFKAAGINGGVDIFIEKCIPIGGGLGGGSSNAATVLMALNRWYQKPLSEKQLRELALLLGADVPFFILQKTALVTGIGEKLMPLNIRIEFPLLIVYPNVSVSTAWAFKNLNLNLTINKIDAIKANLIFRYQSSTIDWLQDIQNDLEQVTFKKQLILKKIKKKLIELGALASVMSGSGSCIVGIYADQNSCQNAFETIKTHSTHEVFQCHVLNNKI